MVDTILGNDLSYMQKCPTETLVTAFQVSKPSHISKKKLDLKILANLNPRNLALDTSKQVVSLEFHPLTCYPRNRHTHTP